MYYHCKPEFVWLCNPYEKLQIEDVLNTKPYWQHLECQIEDTVKLIKPTVFHRLIAAATNYFVLQVPEATIRGRRLFEGGDYSRAASIKEYCHTITFITSYKFVPSFIVNKCVHLCSVHLSRSFKLECSIIRPFLRRHFLF